MKYIMKILKMGINKGYYYSNPLRNEIRVNLTTPQAS